MPRRSELGDRRLIRAFNIFLSGITIAAAVILIDQVSKAWILHSVMQPPRTIEITSFFNLVMGWNRGVSFGIFNNGSNINEWLLPMVAGIISLVLIVWLTRVDRLIVGLALGLIIGGAVGNIIDRLRFGAVVDFLDFHAFGYHWPAFNAADTAITVGAAVLIFDSLFIGSDSRK